MSLNTLRWAASGVLALSLCLLVGSSTLSADKDDDEDAKKEKKAVKEAGEAVLKLMDGGGGDAKAVADKHKIEHVMRAVFKPRNKGGFGYGPKPDLVKPTQDGIESRIINFAKQRQPMSNADLAKEMDALTKAARATRVLADINDFYTPLEKKGDRDPKDWKKYNEDMKKAADDLIDALKKSDPAQVKKATGKLNQSCNECHGKFRDDPD